MPSGFLPDKDLDLLTWAKNCRDKAVVDPQRYGLTQVIADEFSEACDQFAAEMAACDPSMRNKVSVIAKNEKRDVLRNLARNLSRLVQGTASVTDAVKSELGLNIRAPKSKIPVPEDAPRLQITDVRGRTLWVRVFGANTNGRGKPKGMAGFRLYSFLGEQAAENPDAWKLEAISTTTYATINYPLSVEPGTTVWLKACWFNPRNQAGTCCLPKPATIQFGFYQMKESRAMAA